MTTKINLNQYVWITPTEKGNAKIKKHEAEVFHAHQTTGVNQFEPFERDKQGRVKMQGWEVFEIFGQFQLGDMMDMNVEFE